MSNPIFKALVIGCGNIGAIYDLDSKEVLTHVKAFHLDPRFQVVISDKNPEASSLISAKYGIPVLENITLDSLGQYDIMSICTPTETHTELIQMAINAGVKTIICEKPLTYKPSEIEDLSSLYAVNKSKIIVNYIRRFQPKYLKIKELMGEIVNDEKLTNISIRYQRGFLNNCSHAIDTVEFLYGTQLSFENIQIISSSKDYFPLDPTISLFMDGKINVSITGLENVCYSHFEIDLFFERTKVLIRNGGQQVIVDYVESGKTNIFEDCLKDYMVPVIDRAYESLADYGFPDNFINSLNLNSKMLKCLNSADVDISN